MLTAHPLCADDHLAGGDALLLAAADAADHLVADHGVGTHLQAQHADDVFRHDALVHTLQVVGCPNHADPRRALRPRSRDRRRGAQALILTPTLT